MSETNNKGVKKCWASASLLFVNNYLGQRVRCDEKFDGRDYTLHTFWRTGLRSRRFGMAALSETDPGNVDGEV